MQYLSALTLALSTISAVLAAPVGTTLNATTLLENGQTAQQLNTIFQTLNVTDTCTTGDSACVNGSIALCSNSAWDTSRGQCGQNNACFAIPSFREEGVLLACTTEQNAASVIGAAGATGGVFANNGTGTTSTESPASTTTTTITATAPATVTVTVLPTTLFSAQTTVTTTLTPEEASSIFSSIAATATGISPSGGVSSTSASFSATPTATASGSSVTSVPTSSETTSTSFKITGSIILLTAASPTATQSATASAQSAAALASGSTGYSGY